MRKLLLLVLLLCAPSLFATTFFVSNSATNGYVVGVDTNAGTTKGTAVLTLTQAHTLAADGDTIQVNCGTYPTGTNPVNPFAISKAITLTPELTTPTCATIQEPNNASFVLDLIHNAGGTINIGSVVLDCAGSTSTGVRLKDAGANPIYTVNFTGTTIQNCTGPAVNGGSPSKINFNMVAGVISQPQNPGNIVLDFHPAFNSSLAVGSVNVTGTTITALTKTAGTLTPIAFVVAPGGTSTLTTNFSSNTINTDATNTTSSAAYTAVVEVNNIPNAQITNNTMSTVDAPGFIGTGAIDSIRVYSQIWFTVNQNSNNPNINGNSVTNAATNSPHGILVGEDSSVLTTQGHNMSNNAVVANNAVRGQPNTTVLHNIFIGNQIGGIVHDNTAINGQNCFVSKGQTGGTFFTNHAFRCAGQALRAKASSKVNFLTNDVTFVPGQAVSVNGSYGMLADEDTVTGTVSTGVVFSGNTIRAQLLPTYVSAVGVGSTATFDGNNYYLTSGTIQFLYQGTLYTTVPSWSAAHETNLFYQPSGTIGQVF